MVSEWSDAGVAACVAAGPFGGAAFGATGAGAALPPPPQGWQRRLRDPRRSAGLWSRRGRRRGRGWLVAGFCRCDRGCRGVVVSTAEAADTTAVAAMALAAVGVGAGAAAIDPDVTDWLAAIAAAAIASGAVPGPDVAGAVGAAGNRC